jgi:uncharacterized membrane protein YphA (DoxX/SURF4 family)
LLLRCAVGPAVTIQGCAYFPDHEGLLWPILVGATMILTGVCLVLGIITPVFALIAAMAPIGTSLSWLPPARWNLFDPLLPAVLVSVVATAVLFLGPGAVSLDARIFGRRKIIIPKSPRPPMPQD